MKMKKAVHPSLSLFLSYTHEAFLLNFRLYLERSSASDTEGKEINIIW